MGLDEAAALKIKAFEEDVKIHKNRSKYFADKTFEALFGEKTLDYSLPDLAEPEGSTKARVYNPEEEEELRYTPSEEDMLDDEEEEGLRPEGFTSSAADIVNHPVGGRGSHGGSETRQSRAPREPRDRDARPGDHRLGQSQNRGPNQNQRPPQNRPPRADAPRSAEPRPPQNQQQNRGTPRPQEPRRSEGQGGPNPNQNRNPGPRKP